MPAIGFKATKALGYLVVAAAVALTAWWGADGGQETGGAPQGEKARLVKVVDGDTVRVRYGGRVQSVRLLGIDTPETKHSPRLARRARQQGRSPGREARMGAQAAAFLRRLAPAGSLVYLRFDDRQGRRDRHGRLLAYLVNADGVLTNRELVAKGMARVYRRFRFAYREQWLELERRARRERVGFWAHGGP